MIDFVRMSMAHPQNYFQVFAINYQWHNEPRRITFLALDMGFERDAWRKVLVDSANDYTSAGWWVPLFLAYNDKKNGVQFTMSSCLFQ